MQSNPLARSKPRVRKPRSLGRRAVLRPVGSLGAGYWSACKEGYLRNSLWKHYLGPEPLAAAFWASSRSKARAALRRLCIA